jgi:hypothetical protein
LGDVFCVAGSLTRLGRRGDLAAQDLEIIVFRHQLAVLARNVDRATVLEDDGSVLAAAKAQFRESRRHFRHPARRRSAAPLDRSTQQCLHDAVREVTFDLEVRQVDELAEAIRLASKPATTVYASPPRLMSSPA